MSEILILKFIHNLLFVYWLGGDLGVYYSSRYIVRSDISEEARNTAAKIMFWLDQGPRICMTMILPTGIHLAAAMNYIELPPAGLLLIWLVCFAWLANVIFLHATGNQPLGKRLANIDFWFRVLAIPVLGGIAIYVMLNDLVVGWLALKLLIFACLVACGLIVRIFLKPFAPAFADMIQQGATDEGNAIMAVSLKRCRYVVSMIWLGLLVNAALGIHLL